MEANTTLSEEIEMQRQLYLNNLLNEKKTMITNADDGDTVWIKGRINKGWYADSGEDAWTITLDNFRQKDMSKGYPEEHRKNNTLHEYVFMADDLLYEKGKL